MRVREPLCLGKIEFLNKKTVIKSNLFMAFKQNAPGFKPGVFRNALGPLHFGGLSALDAFCSSLKAPKVRPHTSWLGGYS